MYQFKGQTVSQYGPNRLRSGQLGYFLPGSPKIWREAALEYGEEELIYDCPRLCGGGALLNLGDDEGGSAILLAQGLKDRNIDGYVITVDNYSEKQMRRSIRNMEATLTNGCIEIYRETTDEAFKYLTEHSYERGNNSDFNFIFIDADHSYEGVKKDWMNFSQLLAPKGLIAFHDTNQICTNQVIEECVDPNIWTLVIWVNRIKVFTRL